MRRFSAPFSANLRQRHPPDRPVNLKSTKRWDSMERWKQQSIEWRTLKRSRRM
ncbi:hypothetical protein [Limnothrix redekei]|uniref:Uncharacterized protein n=1 Tax=Limnothrix redekei LRLZ20PSL1 TaxID=3112953 RepID=A0ABW7CCH2_9CYAN